MASDRILIFNVSPNPAGDNATNKAHRKRPRPIRKPSFSSEEYDDENTKAFAEAVDALLRNEAESGDYGQDSGYDAGDEDTDGSTSKSSSDDRVAPSMQVEAEENAARNFNGNVSSDTTANSIQHLILPVTASDLRDRDFVYSRNDGKKDIGLIVRCQTRRTTSIDPVEYELAADIEEQAERSLSRQTPPALFAGWNFDIFEDPAENDDTVDHNNLGQDHRINGDSERNYGHNGSSYISGVHEYHADFQFPDWCTMNSDGADYSSLVVEEGEPSKLSDEEPNGFAFSHEEVSQYNENSQYAANGVSMSADSAGLDRELWSPIDGPLESTYRSPYMGPVGWTVPHRAGPNSSQPFLIYQDPSWYEPEPSPINPYWDLLASDDKENAIPEGMETGIRPPPVAEDNIVTEALNIVTLAASNQHWPLRPLNPTNGWANYSSSTYHRNLNARSSTTSGIGLDVETGAAPFATPARGRHRHSNSLTMTDSDRAARR
ncbi:hypothetical protein LOZ65_000431 [Ophidiomyces ophidiicola]|nr:hypothetical protein LOZ65_000431 [Ophidiomyces ophidiicola]